MMPQVSSVKSISRVCENCGHKCSDMGPHSGIGRTAIPSLNPARIFHPGKVNPVMSEMLVQVSS